MPYTTFMDLTFNPANYAGADTAAKEAAVHTTAAKLYGFYAGGMVADTLTPNSANTIASPEVVLAGADSHLKAVISPVPVEVQGAFRNKAAMDADLSAPNGSLVNTFDPKGNLRGRYQKVGAPGTGSWTRVGDIVDYLWTDPNHENRVLNLIPFGSWVNSTPPFPLRGDYAVYPAPPNDDWRGVRLTFTVRAVDLKMGPWTKIALHIQGNVAEKTAALPQVGQYGNYAVPNYFQTSQLISDQLGFSQPGSWGQPNQVPSIKDSGWVDVVIDLSVDDFDWEGLGRVDRPYENSAYHYTAGPVEQLLKKMTGNLYWLAVYEKPQPDSSYFGIAQEPITDAERLTGTLMLKRIKAEYLT